MLCLLLCIRLSSCKRSRSASLNVGSAISMYAGEYIQQISIVTVTVTIETTRPSSNTGLRISRGVYSHDSNHKDVSMKCIIALT